MERKPVLGLYVEGIHSGDRPFGEQTRMFQDLTTYGDELGVHVLVLTPGDYGTNRGIRYKSDTQRWVYQHPIQPDIVLRRTGMFPKLTAATATRELKRLKALGKLHTLPRMSSNKWSFYELLRRVPQLRSYLPKTSLCESGRELYDMLRSRPDVYVKPLGGTRGVSIYRLKRNGDTVHASWERRVVPRKQDQTSKEFKPETRVEEQYISSLNECLAFWTRTGLRRAIVQDTIHLPKKDDAPYDFRWLMGPSDKPSVVGRVARMGQPKAITTNIHTGGTSVSAQEMIEELVGRNESDRTLRRMDDVAKRVVTTLAKKYGPFAEVGIDLALTEDGDIYIFEMNPTPGRRMLRSLDPGLHRLSLETLLEYVIRAARPSRGHSGRER